MTNNFAAISTESKGWVLQMWSLVSWVHQYWKCGRACHIWNWGMSRIVVTLDLLSDENRDCEWAQRVKIYSSFSFRSFSHVDVCRLFAIQVIYWGVRWFVFPSINPLWDQLNVYPQTIELAARIRDVSATMSNTAWEKPHDFYNLIAPETSIGSCCQYILFHTLLNWSVQRTVHCWYSAFSFIHIHFSSLDGNKHMVNTVSWTSLWTVTVRTVVSSRSQHDVSSSRQIPRHFQVITATTYSMLCVNVKSTSIHPPSAQRSKSFRSPRPTMRGTVACSFHN